MTLKEVAQRLGTTEATAQRYESTIKNIPYEVIEKYAKIFDVSPAHIMGWDTEDYSIKCIDDKVLLELFQKLPLEEQKHLLAYAEFLNKQAEIRKSDFLD
jgi:transcriptional regulator with XRE-family HTH domain